MKWFNGYRMRLMLVGFVVAIVLEGGSAKADFVFGEPTNLGITANSQYHEYDPSVSADGLSLYFSSNSPGGSGNYDLWVTEQQTTRQTTELVWSKPINLGPNVNSSNNDLQPDISSDGLSLYFSSDRPGGSGLMDLYVTRRDSLSEAWGPPVNLGPTVNSSTHDFSPSISANELSLFFSDADWIEASPRPGGYGATDIWMIVRPTKDDTWSTPMNLGPIVNSPSIDGAPSISADGLALFFHRLTVGVPSLSDIWLTTRATKEGEWGTPVNLGSKVNSSVWEGNADVSADGSTLFFAAEQRTGGVGGADLWQAPIIPIVDLNSDGIVDAADMCIVVDHWGTDNSLCDIGPMPWGDGVVDVQDLIVLSEHLFEDLRIVAHWKFDETGGSIAYDSIDVDNGICHGEPLWQPTGGMIDGALQLDGIDDYVETPFVRNPADGSLSAFAWIKGGSPGQTIISQIDGTRGAGSAWVCTDPSDGRLITKLMHPPFSPLDSESVISDGLWHHIGVVYDFDGLHRCLYLDGAEVAKDISPVASVGSDCGLYIGADKTLEVATFFSGLIDDVRIYDAALNEEEIAALAQ